MQLDANGEEKDFRITFLYCLISEVDDGPVEGGAMTGNEGRTEGEQDEQERN